MPGRGFTWTDGDFEKSDVPIFIQKSVVVRCGKHGIVFRRIRPLF